MINYTKFLLKELVSFGKSLLLIYVKIDFLYQFKITQFNFKLKLRKSYFLYIKKYKKYDKSSF